MVVEERLSLLGIQSVMEGKGRSGAGDLRVSLCLAAASGMNISLK